MNVSEILKYLYGDMPEQEKKIFEQALNNDKALKYKFQLVKELDNDCIDEKALSLVFKLEKIKRQYKLLCDQDMVYQASESEISLLVKEVDTIALLEEFILGESKGNADVNACECPEPVSESNKFSKTYSLKKIFTIAAVFCFALITSFYYIRSDSSERLFSRHYEKFSLSKVRHLDPKTDIRYLYATGNFRGAVNLSEQIIKTDPSSSVAHFYAGLSFLELKQYQRAIERLSLVTTSGDEAFCFPAQWYESLCYIKTGQMVNAKKVLTNLVNSNSPVYSKKAVALLEELE